MFLVSPQKLKSWYQKGYVAPLVYSFKSNLDLWQMAKQVLAGSANAFFLDSARYQGEIARYSYLGWKPFQIFKTKKISWIVSRLRNLFEPYLGRKWKELPFFTGGAVGFFSYELAHAFERLPNLAKDDLHLDMVSLLFVRDLIVFDHKEKICFLIANLIPRKDGFFEKAFDRAVTRIEKMHSSLRE